MDENKAEKCNEMDDLFALIVTVMGEKCNENDENKAEKCNEMG